MPSSAIRFSVVVPLYNKAKFIVATILSAANQEPPPSEIIVIDDGSTDDGPEHVIALANPLVRLFKQRNAGVSAARNRGISEACGDWVCFLDADDLYLPGFLHALSAIVEKCPDARVIATGYQRRSLDATTSLIQHTSYPQGGYIHDFFRTWSDRPTFSASSIAVFRPTLLTMKPCFPVGERLGEDQDLWFRLAESHPIAFDPRPLVIYRVDVAGSATHNQDVSTPLPCYERLAQRLETGQVPANLRAGARRLLASHWLNLARAHLDSGDLSGAWKLFQSRFTKGHTIYRLRIGLRLAIAHVGFKF